MSGPLHSEERLRRIEALLKYKGNREEAARYLGMKSDALRANFTGLSVEEMLAERGRLLAEFSAVELPELNLDIIERLLKTGATLEQLCDRAEATYGQVLDELEMLKTRGFNVVRSGELFRIEKKMQLGNVAGNYVSFKTDNNNRIKFGVSSDKHYCSKYCREEVIAGLYQWFADEDVIAVLDSGNYIEGESRFNRYDLTHHGLDAQAQHLVATLPQHKGLVTYAVSGDDHEGWYAQREGIDVGRYVEGVFRQVGREDWMNLGYMEAYIEVENANTGVTSKILVMHPGGGSAYAVSYAPQKICESFTGGEKPGVVLIGHFHKLSVNLLRGIWAIQVGCGQDQTPWARKKRLDPHVGGIIMELEQDPETGAFISCRTEIKRWFNRGYYNHRWSPHGAPVMPKQDVNPG